MPAPTQAYLVEEAATKKRRLVAASAPANAIAFCAKGSFTAQRVEGAVLDTLMSTMTLEHVTQPKPEGGEEPQGDGDNGTGGDGDKPKEPATGQGAKGGSGNAKNDPANKGSGGTDKPGE